MPSVPSSPGSAKSGAAVPRKMPSVICLDDKLAPVKKQKSPVWGPRAEGASTMWDTCPDSDEEDDDWGALDRTMMEELAKGWEETSTEAVKRFQGDAEEDDRSQSLLDDMEDMFA